MPPRQPANSNSIFSAGRIVERVKAGLARAKSQGTRLERHAHRITDTDLATVATLSLRAAAEQLGLPKSVVHRARQQPAVAA